MGLKDDYEWGIIAFFGIFFIGAIVLAILGGDHTTKTTEVCETISNVVTCTKTVITK